MRNEWLDEKRGNFIHRMGSSYLEECFSSSQSFGFFPPSSPYPRGRKIEMFIWICYVDMELSPSSTILLCMAYMYFAWGWYMWIPFPIFPYSISSYYLLYSLATPLLFMVVRTFSLVSWCVVSIYNYLPIPLYNPEDWLLLLCLWLNGMGGRTGMWVMTGGNGNGNIRISIIVSTIYLLHNNSSNALRSSTATAIHLVLIYICIRFLFLPTPIPKLSIQ